MTRRIDTRTKIVATVGPACGSADQLAELIEAGVDVFRINMAHGDQPAHEAYVAAIRRASQRVGQPVGVLVDLGGPKIRLGALRNDPTACPLGSEFRFVHGDRAPTEDTLVSNYQPLVDELSVGDRIMLADGTVSLVVTAKTADEAVCRVVEAGTIRSRQGINLPGVKLAMAALTEQDQLDAAWAAATDVDFVGLSFVRCAADVQQLRGLLESHGSTALIVAKIEKQEALDGLDDVVASADAVMVARGDLGVEIDFAQTPIAQKRIITTCHKHHKSVIVATQMLESMTEAQRPTRAEATDVANAILDGTDACMLSAETAIGQHPTLVVEAMNRIMQATEQLLRDNPSLLSESAPLDVHPITSAVVYGAAQIARRVNARLVVIATCSGATSLAKSKQRDFIPTIGVSHNEATLRRMALHWGITPLAGVPVQDAAQLREFITQWGLRRGRLEPGDRIVIVTGTDVIPGAHNLVFVHQL